jgi:hypothetical protein
MSNYVFGFDVRSSLANVKKKNRNSLPNVVFFLYNSVRLGFRIKLNKNGDTLLWFARLKDWQGGPFNTRNSVITHKKKETYIPPNIKSIEEFLSGMSGQKVFRSFDNRGAGCLLLNCATACFSKVLES